MLPVASHDPHRSLRTQHGRPRTTELSVIYGSLTSALVFLYAVYLYASSLLLGAEVAAGWARPQTVGGGEPIRAQLRRGVLGLFADQKRGSS